MFIQWQSHSRIRFSEPILLLSHARLYMKPCYFIFWLWYILVGPVLCVLLFIHIGLFWYTCVWVFVLFFEGSSYRNSLFGSRRPRYWVYYSKQTLVSLLRATSNQDFFYLGILCYTNNVPSKPNSIVKADNLEILGETHVHFHQNEVSIFLVWIVWDYFFLVHLFSFLICHLLLKLCWEHSKNETLKIIPEMTAVLGILTYFCHGSQWFSWVCI